MAAGRTYEPIATTTLGSNQTSVTFSSITSAYTDLVFVVNAKGVGTATSTDSYIELNSTTTGYSTTTLYGAGATAGTGRSSNADAGYTSPNANLTNFTIYTFNIMNYSNTNTNKTIIYRGGTGDTSTTAVAVLWRNNAAINSIKISATDNKGGGTVDFFATGSTFTLYGIAAA